MSVSLPWRDVAALLLAAGAAVASLVVWVDGTVNLGMELTEADGGVRVADVTPDGNAAGTGWHPGILVLDVTTVNGSDVERGDPVRLDGEAFVTPYPVTRFDPYGLLFGAIGQPLEALDTSVSPPLEAVESARIETAVGGDLDAESEMAYVYAAIDRTLLELVLRSSIWIAAFGAALGVAVWRLLRHGIAGEIGGRHAVVLGCAAAVPFLIVPVVEVGTPAGIVAGFLVPASAALVLGLAIAREHNDRSWATTATAGACVAAGLAVVLVIRYMSSPVLAPGDRGSIFLLVAAIALIPAVVTATAEHTAVRQRLGLASLALIPGAAHTVVGPRPDVLWPVTMVALLIGWHVLPTDRAIAALGQRVSGPRGATPLAATPDVGPITPRRRDGLALALLVGAVIAAILTGLNTWTVVLGLGLAWLVWFAIQRGFFGSSWIDSAVPLAVAVGIPVVLAALEGRFSGPWGHFFVFMPIALAGLAVADILAARHPDPSLGRFLLGASVGVVLLVAFLSILAAPEPLVLIPVVLVALIPGIPLALAAVPDNAQGVSSRVETMAVSFTPAAAAVALFPEGWLIFGGWLAALVIWKYFTVTPMLRFAQRTQLQRDVAVAAAETERARLAADLHDDALQQLTMLVRTLDERGDTEGADEAREIATKLRSVVGDLRLPILDDLGAGAALEWLVERVEPLAGGSVKLERSDEMRPPATVELAVFRVAQEALTNAIKHGRPPIAIRYDVRTDGRVTLAIDDSGEGIGSEAADGAPTEGHFGLVNMQQRAEQIGALLDVRRWPGGGTRVALEWRPQ